MDKFDELTTGAKLVLGAAVALLIVSLFNWFEFNGVGFASMWNGIGVLAGLLLIALIVWQALRLANINLEIGVTPSMITAALSVLVLVFVAIRWLDTPGVEVDRTIWAWLGLALAIVLVIGAWLNMQAAGEGIADIRASVAGAAAAAKGAVDRDDQPAAAAPATTDAPAAPPAEAAGRGTGRPTGRIAVGAGRSGRTPRGRPDATFSRAALPRERRGSPATLTAMTEIGTLRVKTGLAEMLKGGVIMDVVDADQARIAEEAGACAVMALERVPADIRRQGGVARMSDPREDPRDPGDRLDPGDGEVPHRALRRGADPRGARGRLHRRVRGADTRRRRAPRRQARVHRPVRLRRDEPGRGAPPDRRGRGDDPHEGRGRHRRHRQRRHPHALGVRWRSAAAVAARGGALREAKELRAPFELVRWVAENGQLPVVTFTAGGIATPADAALCMQLGADGVFVGSGIFKSGRDKHDDHDGWAEDVSRRAKAIVEATTHYADPKILAEVSAGLGAPDGGHLLRARSPRASGSKSAAGSASPPRERRSRPAPRARSRPARTRRRT